MRKSLKFIKQTVQKYPLTSFFISWLLVVFVASIIFYLRYPYAYSYANFYAEDGTVFVKNILEEGPFVGPLSLFNGYFVLGQYLLVNAGMALNIIVGEGIATLPKALAVVSYLFWGFVVSLPYLLFKKRLGILLSLLTVLVLSVVPFGGYDYAIIGTIGNLKFAFFYAATLLIIYRNQEDLVTKRWQFILVDAGLLLAVCTNILTIALLLFGLWRYKKEIGALFKSFGRGLKKLPLSLYSLVGLGLVSGVYAATVTLRGIPDMPGYLDEPLIPSALLDIVYRGSVYAVTFPVNVYMTDMVALVLLIVSAVLAVMSRQRIVLAFVGFAIVINVLGFALSRPGITHLFQSYTGDGGPGLFFYAGTMLFIFAIAYATSDWFRRQGKKVKLVLSLLIVAFVLIAAPASGLKEVSHAAITSNRPSAQSEVNRVCSIKPTPEFVEIGIYPAVNWTLTLPREDVCTN